MRLLSVRSVLAACVRPAFCACALSLVVTLAPHAAVGQSAAADAPRPASFRIYLWPQDSGISSYLDAREGGSGYSYVAPKIAYQKNPQGDVETVDAVDRQLTKAYRYQGEEALTFFREEPGVDGVPVRIPLGTVARSDLGEDTLLMFFPVKNGGQTTYRILSVAAPSKRIPKGKAMVYNLTREKLAVFTGKSPQLFTPGGINLVEMGFNEDALMPFRIMVEDEGEWVLTYSNALIIGEAETLVYFIFPQEGGSDRFNILSVNVAL